MAQSKRLSGDRSRAYAGVEPLTPPELLIQDAAPTSADSLNINLGTLWLVEPEPLKAGNQQLWMLAKLVGVVASWVQLYPGGGANVFPTDSGTAVPLAGVLNIFGDTRITTSGAGNTVTIHLTGSVASSFPCNVGTAIPFGGVLNIFGTTGIGTTGSGNTVTISLSGSVATSYVTDAGTAVPVGGVLNVLGGTNINTTGAGNTVTINLNNSVTLSGSLTVTSLGAGVVQTNAGGLIFSNKGTDGQTLISATAGVPMWANLTSLGATITITNGPNTINLEAAIVPSTKAGFFAYLSSTYQPGGSSVYVPFDTVLFDRTGSFTGATGTFTAPTNATYRLSAQLVGVVLDHTDEIFLYCVTPSLSSFTYYGTSLGTNARGAAPPFHGGPQGVYITVEATKQMVAGEIANILFRTNSTGLPIATVLGGPAIPNGIYCYFCGEQI